MGKPKGKKGSKGGKKVRVPFRRNRLKPRRTKDWTDKNQDAGDHEQDTARIEHIVTKGELSRHRTITVDEDGLADPELQAGVVVAMRGLFADVDDGTRVWPCTIRRVLRTQLIEERHPVTIGDRVRFRITKQAEGVVQEGVIHHVEERKGRLRRMVNRRIHTIAANVDYAVIVSSAAMPAPKPHMIDRYIVASLSGDIIPVVCMNKLDLDVEGRGAEVVERYADLGYRTLLTSAKTGQGIDDLREVFKGKSCVLAGQSGVGKSSLLNAVEPGLNLRIGDIVEHTNKGRHTTSTAILIKLKLGAYVVDTPGIKSLDVSPVPINEIELHFVEFGPHIPNCKFPDCTHTHETDCAVQTAVDSGEIHEERYESYVRLFEEYEAAYDPGA